MILGISNPMMLYIRLNRELIVANVNVLLNTDLYKPMLVKS